MKGAIVRKIIEWDCRPLDYLKSVADRPYPALLESSLAANGLGRYSILCWDPFRRVICHRGHVEVQDMYSGFREVVSGGPFRVLAQEFDRYRLNVPPDFDLPFAGGAVGYFSYDLRHWVEKLPRLSDYDLDVPEMALCFYDKALIFDHERGVTEFVGSLESDPENDVPAPAPRDDTIPEVGGVELRSSFTHDGYVRAVEQVKEYIAAGDIFQANLSQRFDGLCAADGLAIYQRLRAINPAPFSAYLKYPDFEIASSSPERFLLLDDDRVITRPIKGTRPRTEGDEAFNAAMQRELLSSAKDHAELAMIVDLERNDLGRVCRYGTVNVKEHAALETYPTVFHLVSTVEGRLYREAYDEFALIKAAFPGGSITGAPKIRAMEIIEELEPQARAVYTGAIGYISFHGRMDLNIVIRTILKLGDSVYIHVGGGIVADSDPEMEYMETLHKGKALFQAVNATNLDEIIGTTQHAK